MFSYKWETDFGTVYKSEFYSTWKRLDYCKAAYRRTTKYDSGYWNALKSPTTTNTYDFISYGTPIAHIKVLTTHKLERTNIAIYLNEDSYNCSNTTIHQLSRFLNMLAKWYFIDNGDLSYYAIKEAMRSNRMHFFYDMALGSGRDSTETGRIYHIHLFRKTESELLEMMDTENAYLAVRC